LIEIIKSYKIKNSVQGLCKEIYGFEGTIYCLRRLEIYLFFFNIGFLYEFVYGKIICADKILLRDFLNASTVC